MNPAGTIAGTPGVFAETPSLFHALAAGRALAEIDEVEAVTVHLGSVGEVGALRASGPIDVVLEGVIDLPDVRIRETRSRYLRRHRIRWRPGDPSPGVSVLYRVNRNESLTSAEFHDHWENRHGPLALTHHLGMWDYEQLSVVDDPGPDAIDGVAVVQFPCLADYEQRFFDGPTGRDLIRADAAAFTAANGIHPQLTTEQVMKAPPVAPGTVIDVADHRQLELSADPDEVWAVLGDFGAILDWWPGGLTDVRLSGSDPLVRTLTRQDGSEVAEALVRHDDAERMFQLEVTAGFPSEIRRYTCRYEVRSVPNGCRLDWDPRAEVEAEGLVLLAGLVDAGWRQITRGLAERFTVTPPSMGGLPEA